MRDAAYWIGWAGVIFVAFGLGVVGTFAVFKLSVALIDMWVKGEVTQLAVSAGALSVGIGMAILILATHLRETERRRRYMAEFQEAEERRQQRLDAILDRDRQAEAQQRQAESFKRMGGL